MTVCVHEKFVDMKLKLGGVDKVYMRPLLVSELALLRRVICMPQDTEEVIIAYMSELMKLIEPSVQGGLKDEWELDSIVDHFYDINSPKDKSGAAKGKEGVDKIIASLPTNIDFLVSQGHVRSGIMDYCLPLFISSIDAALERLTGKQKKTNDPVKSMMDLATKLNIPITLRN